MAKRIVLVYTNQDANRAGTAFAKAYPKADANMSDWDHVADCLEDFISNITYAGENQELETTIVRPKKVKTSQKNTEESVK